MQFKALRLRPWHLGALVAALAFVLYMTSPVAAIITVPPTDNIFFQTTGERAARGIGDFYTNLNGDNVHHLAQINIPCLPTPQTFRIELFDPEMFDAGAPGVETETVDDERRNDPDTTNFRLFNPSGGLVASLTINPATDPGYPNSYHNTWVAFATISSSVCGTYNLEVWTGDEGADTRRNNDDNAWKYRLLGGPGAVGTETFNPAIGPDGRPGSGDEAWLGVQRLSYQHNLSATQSFYWFVDDDGDPTWRGHNFDADDGTALCAGGPAVCSLIYDAPTLPDTTVLNMSGNDEWNPPGSGGIRSGDVFDGVSNPTEPGPWRAAVTIPVNNQYIIEIENGGKPIFLEPLDIPRVVISKDDGLTTVSSPSQVTYTIRIENTGTGAAMALPGAGPEIVDNLDPNQTFVSCAINPPLTGTCSQVSPGVVHFQLTGQTNALNLDGSSFGPIPGFLPSAGSGLRNFGTVTITVNNAPGLPAGTNLTNRATVDWSDIYGNNFAPVSASDTDVVVAPPVADLSIVKARIPPPADPVPVGSTITYTLTVTNNGPDNITAPNFASVVDGFPPQLGNVSWTCAVIGVGSCSAAGTGPISDQITLNAGAGNSLVYTVTATVLAPGPGNQITNTASINHPGTDPTPGNNSSTVTTPTTQGSVDLALVKTRTSASPVLVGQSVTYDIVVTNNGPGNAVNATVTDSFPANLSSITWTCTAVGGAVCGTPSGVGNINTLVSIPGPPAVASVTFSVTATAVAPGSPNPVVNSATVSTPPGVTDTNPNNNTDTADVDINQRQADLAVTKSGPAGPLNPGNAFTYTIVVVNNGPDNVTNARVIDNFPGDITVNNWTCVVTGVGSCTAGPVAGPINDVVSLNAGPGNSLTYTVNATVRATSGPVVDNTASVTPPSDTRDPNLSNNNDPHSFPVNLPRADLRVEKTGSPGPVNVGDPIQYTITVTNLGPSAVNNATVVDNFSPNLGGITWTCAGFNGASCTASGVGSINDTNVDFPAPQPAPADPPFVVYTVNATVIRSGAINNTASVIAPPGMVDPVSSNDSASYNISPPGGGGGGSSGGGGSGAPTGGPAIVRIDPVITKLGSPDNAIIGEQVTWTVIVTNPSGVPVGPVTVSDTIPPQFTIVNVTSTAGVVSVNGNFVSIDLGTLSPGQSVTITIETLVNELALPGEICNEAFLNWTSTASARDCIDLFPETLPPTGGQPVGPDIWRLVGLIGGAASLALGAGIALLLRRRRGTAD